MKPGLVGGSIMGGMLYLTLLQVSHLMAGDLWKIPAVAWDVTFSIIGLYQLFGPTPPQEDGKP